MKRLALVVLFFAAAANPARANDINPFQLRDWLCTFFSAPEGERVALLARAPVGLAAQGEIVEYVEDRRNRSLVKRWTVSNRRTSQRMAWEVVYSFQTDLGYPDDNYGHSLRITRRYRGYLMLGDDASVQSFYRNVGAPEFDRERSRYKYSEREEMLRGVWSDRFAVEFSMSRQELTVDWTDERYAARGRRFCS